MQGIIARHAALYLYISAIVLIVRVNAKMSWKLSANSDYILANWLQFTKIYNNVKKTTASSGSTCILSLVSCLY